MSNFVFSETLEISVIEYRLAQLFEMLEKVGQNHFFPSLIFNETFWQLPNEKKKSILSFNQLEWALQNPIHESFFFLDPSILDVVRSVKISYFSYSKLDFQSLLELLRSKNNFSVSDFTSFGDAQNSPITILNRFFLERENTLKEPIIKNNINKFDVLAKISAVKFYTRFLKKRKVSVLILTSGSDTLYWEFFFKSLKLLDTKQNTDFLSKLHIVYTTPAQNLLDQFRSNIADDSILKSLSEKDQINFDVLDIINFNTDLNFDYIFSAYQLSIQPTDILIKSGRNIYNLIGRLVYTSTSENPEDAIKKVAELQSPFKSKSIDMNDLKSLDFEISAEIYKNQKIIDLIEKHVGFLEGTYVRFSSIILNFLIQVLKSLNKGGYVEIWDINESKDSFYFQNLLRPNDQTVSITVNYDLYASILNSFDDIKVKTSTRTIQKVLSDEILDGKGEFITLENLMSYALENPPIWRKLFSIENFSYKKELKTTSNKYNIFQQLYKKRILLFGIPSLLYKAGFKKFKKNILNDQVLNKYIDKDILENSAANNYINEYMISLVPNTSKLVPDQKFILIAKDKDSSQNKEFFEYLGKIGFEQEKIMKVLAEIWDELIRYSNQKMTLSLLEIERV